MLGKITSVGAVWLAVTVFCTSSLHAQGSELIGKWESVTRSRGGVGTTLELDADGTATVRPGAMVDFRYSLNDSTLRLSLTDPFSGQTSERVLQVRITADSMIQSDPTSGHETRLARSHPVERDPTSIAGTWSFPHPSRARGFQIFTDGGEMHLRIPFRADRGTYSISGDSLVISIGGEETLRSRYRVDRDELTLASANDLPKRYVRVTW